MPMNERQVRRHLSEFDFRPLFLDELGWDRYTAPLTVQVDGQSYSLTPVAEKRGMVAYLCPTLGNGQFPDYATRRRIEHEVTKSTREHLIIYTDSGKSTQVWQWVKREAGKPAACREHTYHRGQTGEALAQKLHAIAFSLEEEEELTLVRVTGGARAAFDIERVTRRFYDRFKTEHTAFLGFVEGIGNLADREWYASVMLNRLMFIYFIQKKRFLDGDPDYLRNRLLRVQREHGRDKFHTFYRHFLLRLCHEGLGTRPEDRAADLDTLLGEVPYLNGGLFMPHPVEQRHPDIQIRDEAFERVFNFFDQYQWHLDERPLRNDNEINPDVLGFIFEKYINQKQMGAYYTKEDITEYITRNTVVPYLLDATRDDCLIAFEGERSVWRLLQQEPDRYIFAAVKHGMDNNLPAAIAAGMSDVSKRGDWNKPAPTTFALPTETWREVVARRKRYVEIRSKLAAGEVQSVNELITLNLDIRQFAQDVIETSEGPDFLRAFWKALETARILDPTVGSGAFLFAALNVLEPLYEACLERMGAFISEANRLDGSNGREQHADFIALLARISKHPNRRYYVLKSIMVNNLFGVDIMEEATEICKLRLFLKLVAQVGTVANIEPLPDVDFNIRAGNSLVGYSSYKDFHNAVVANLSFDDTLERISRQCEDIKTRLCVYHGAQEQSTSIELARMKSGIQDALQELNTELNSHLASRYGVDRENIVDARAFERRYTAWENSHQPFHWFAQFPEAFHRGGFHVIIGNPPYVAYSKVRPTYSLPPNSYKTESCGNLYAYVMERSYHLLQPLGRFGMIVPISSIAGEQFAPLADLTFKKSTWVSTFSNRPAKLFYGVEQRLAIILLEPNTGPVRTSHYQHWYEQERDYLFDRLTYHPSATDPNRGMPYKTGSNVEADVLSKILRQKGSIWGFHAAGRFGCWYHDGPTYWIRALPFKPNSGIESERSSHYHHLSASTRADGLILSAILSSSTYYLFFKAVSNCRDFGRKELDEFRINALSESARQSLVRLGEDFCDALTHSAKRCSRSYPSGIVEYEEYYPQLAKSVLDAFDLELAKHYGFTPEELDFVINYDIKYRMGRNADDEG